MKGSRKNSLIKQFSIISIGDLKGLKNIDMADFFKKAIIWFVDSALNVGAPLRLVIGNSFLYPLARFVYPKIKNENTWSPLSILAF